MKLKVKSNYRNANIVYLAGSVIEVTEGEAEVLMRDSPGSFEEVVPAQRLDGNPDSSRLEGEMSPGSPPDPIADLATKAFDSSPADKMLRKGRTK
jgi:hypothetical protein